MFSTVAVVGAGTMGQGIAQLLVEAGRTVFLYDQAPAALHAAVAAVTKRVLTRADSDAASGTLQAVTSLAALAEAQLLVEAIPERLQLKQALFAELEAHLSPDAVMASNTSCLDLNAIAAATNIPRRVVGMHFFNPPPMMPLIEVVPATATGTDVLDAVQTFATQLGKTPVTVANRPGFIVNRLLFAMIAEASRILDEGWTSATDVDRALCLGASHPIGPLALADFIGLDVTLDILVSLESGLGPRYAPTARLRELVAAGHLGRKTGMGFFPY